MVKETIREYFNNMVSAASPAQSSYVLVTFTFPRLGFLITEWSTKLVLTKAKGTGSLLSLHGLFVVMGVRLGCHLK